MTAWRGERTYLFQSNCNFTMGFDNVQTKIQQTKKETFFVYMNIMIEKEE